MAGQIPEELVEEIGEAIIKVCRRHSISEKIQGDIIRATCDAVERATVAPGVTEYLASLTRKL